MAEPLLRIQVCYALPDESYLQEMTVAAGTTLEQALRSAGVLQQYPQIDLATDKLGIFGKLRPPDTVLRDGDRVEVYRPLQADPKETRRRRAKRKAPAAAG
jgi:putative ubiquitin-RnfH superfamily antitoxin RatB of RatAB toxin-antitoxin module